jgi:[protein-PII] uridylyltransferase
LEAQRNFALGSAPMPAPDFTTQFIASMPAAYRSAFTARDAEEHAQIVYERGMEPVRVVVWRTLPHGALVMCVVADDRPGLVALVSAAFVAHGLDVRSAQIYCRRRADGGSEAVDFFWLRPASSGVPVERARLVEGVRTIKKLVAAEGAAVAVPEAARTGDRRLDGSYAPDPAAAGHWQLSVQAPDYPGLLHSIARLLHQHGLEVVRSEVRTEEGIARDLFVLTAEKDEPMKQRLSDFRRALIEAVAGNRRAG